MLLNVLVACVLSKSAVVQDQPPIVPEVRPGKNGRGRDPWVFRLIFEDRTRMVAVALADDFWYVFNPETCAPFKVWNGKMDFRGKVWDFSQDNSRAKGTVHAAAQSEIATLADGDLGTWAADRVSWNGGWKFDGDGAKLTSPPIDLSGSQRVFIAFDEQSRRGRIKVEVSDDGGRTWDKEYFSSATSVTNDTDWQWNFKQILSKSAHTRVRFVQEKASHMKTLRNVRVFGDQAAWLDATGRPLKVVWRGYETLHDTDAVAMLYDLVLPNGHVVSVRQRPEVFGPLSWYETFSIEGLKSGDKVQYRPLPHLLGLRSVVLPSGVGRADNNSEPSVIESNGDMTVRYGYAR